MEDFKTYILENHQVRKSREQKHKFREWLQPCIQSMGYDCIFQEYKKNGRGVNVVVGNPESAKVILSAHYDTQAMMLSPRIMLMSNWFLCIISELVTFIPFFLVDWIIVNVATALGVDSLWANRMGGLVMILMLWQTFYGIANKHTANDNTSGVITLLTIMKRLKLEHKDKVAFIFFDQEEIGLVGSRFFRRESRYNDMEIPLINFDCVSDGDNLCFIYKPQFKRTDNYESFKSVLDNQQETNKKIVFASSKKMMYPSDQMIFANGIGVAALKKVPVFGYYLDRIHTPLDTKYDQQNIDILSKVTIDFIEKL